MAFLASVVLICLLASCASAFEVTVDAYEKTCFYEDLDAGTTFSGSFEVIQGGDGTVDVQVCLNVRCALSMR